MADKGVDYVAIGPIFASPTKSGRTPLGLATLAEARRRVACPLVAIGGITVERVRGVVEAGADGVAVVSAALAGGRIAEQVAGLLAALDDA